MPSVIDPETVSVDELPGIWTPVQWPLSEEERIQELETQATASLLFAVDTPEAILRLLLNETVIERAFDPPEGYLAYLETQGVVVEFCPVDDKGRVPLTKLEKRVDDDTFLICCILANNETGVIQDIKAVTKIARAHGALVLTDCVQALGKIPIDFHAWDVDYASFSAHKLYGPKGVGALYVKQGSPFTPFLHGGHQESGLRAGPESIHNIVGFGTACQDVDKLLAHAGQIRALKSLLIERHHMA